MSGRRRPSPAPDAEPEAPLTRAALIMVLGAVAAGLGHGGSVEGGATSQVLRVGGSLLIAGGLVATLRALYQRWKGRGQ